MVVREACPAYGSQYFKKNGYMHTGKQNHQYQAYGCQFVLHADNRAIHEEQRTLVERLLCENISLHSICRAVGDSIWWLMDCMVAYFQAVPDYLDVQPVTSPCDVIMGHLEAEADEMGAS